MKILKEWGVKMKLEINLNKPFYDENEILDIQPTDLNEFYDPLNEENGLKMYFQLLATYIRVKNREKKAHAAFLITYYLFILLTPPASCELALYYIRKAIELDPLEEYIEFEKLVLMGN